MSQPKRQLFDPIHQGLPLKKLRAAPNSSPLSSLANDHAIPTEVTSNKAAATLGVSTLSTTDVPQVAQGEASTAISVLKTVPKGLRDGPIELPLLQVAVGDLLGCIIHSDAEEQDRQAFEELSSTVTNLATLLQRHAVELEPHDGPYSVASIVQVIDEQTRSIRAQQEHSRASRSITVKDNGEVPKRYQRIGALFKRLQSGILLSLRDESKEQEMEAIVKTLCPVYDAYHDAALPTSATKRVGCTEGTRMDLLDTTLDWAHGSDAAKIYWLNGMAGTGKTTIAYTLCEMLLQDKLLAASFFCSRNSADCCDVNRIVLTIAYQLGQHSPLYRQELFKALKSYSDISKRKITTQFRHLISEPFERIGEAMPKDVIVVIDALDECADEAGAKNLLDLLIRHAAKLPIKFFIASRPEPAISDSMEVHTGNLRSILWLHDIEESLVQADIKLYLTEALASTNISLSEIDQLATKAGKLFIFAATAVRYIRPDRGAVNHRKRLLEVLELQPNPENLRHQDIDSLYATIVSNALNEKMYTKAEMTTRRQALWTVICAKEPLTIPALAELLNIADEDIRPAILPLQSVLHLSESNGVISSLHASFSDFLLAKERAGQLHCDDTLYSSYLATCCLELMERSLRFNICGLESSYAFDKDVLEIQSRVDEAIPTSLFYSCMYWGDHLTRSPPSPTLLSLLASFLQYRLLFWMEVLNLKGRIGHGDFVLSQALMWIPIEDEWAELRDFTHDARNFLTPFASNPTSLSTPHIYISTLPFTSTESRVRATYWPRMRGLMEIGGVASEGRSKSVLATCDVGSAVRSIAQSSDGRRVASGSLNGEVSVWDVSSSARILGPLKSHGEVLSVVFSPDNSRIAAGSSDHTIRVWDAYNGALVVGPLRGHTSHVISVAFSPDGTRLASSCPNTIRMWDARTGAAIGDAYSGHQGTAQSVAFSPDGEHLASGSLDHTIRVWNWRTSVTTLRPLEGHSGSVYSIAYSSDGSRLASGSDDCTVRVWNMLSGTLLAGPLEGHFSHVASVSFSPNDTQIVSGSGDDTICVWEAESGDLLAGPFRAHDSAINAVLFTTDGTRILSGSWDYTIRVWDARQATKGSIGSFRHPSRVNCIVMSPDGTRAASGLRDKTICVWDTHSGVLVAGPLEGHTEHVTSVAFSLDGARIVSGSQDRTLRSWDASTGALLAGPFKGHTEWVYSVAFSPDGSQIASGSGDQTIRLWDSHTAGEPVAEPFRGHTKAVRSIAFSPDGTRIVSGSRDRTVRMWVTSNGTTLWTSGAHTDRVRCLAFSPDGTRVVSGSQDKTIIVLDAGDGAVLHGPFTGHAWPVSSVAFSPEGSRVVSGSLDQTVRVWDVQSGMMVVGHTGSDGPVAFSPGDAFTIVGLANGAVRFWDAAAAIRTDTTLFDGWTLNGGWVIDSQSRRLFWVPPGLRDGFWFPTPSNPLMSNARVTTHIDNTTPLGDRWHECYDACLAEVPF